MTFRAAARRSHPGAVFSVRGHRSHWRTTGTCRGLIHMETPPTSDSVLAAVRCLMTPSAALSLARCAALACCAALPSTSAACHEYRRKVGYAVRLSGPECFRLKTMRKLPITGTLASAGQPSFRALCGGAWSWLRRMRHRGCEAKANMTLKFVRGSHRVLLWARKPRLQSPIRRCDGQVRRRHDVQQPMRWHLEV